MKDGSALDVVIPLAGNSLTYTFFCGTASYRLNISFKRISGPRDRNMCIMDNLGNQIIGTTAYQDREEAYVKLHAGLVSPLMYDHCCSL